MTYAHYDLLTKLNRRTVAVIHNHIVKRSKRTIIPQFFHPQNNEKLVATWRLDLNKIRLVFDVRYSTSS